MKAQRGEETCPRSHSQLAAQNLGSMPLLGRLDIELGAWEGTQLPENIA